MTALTVKELLLPLPLGPFSKLLEDSEGIPYLQSYSLDDAIFD